MRDCAFVAICLIHIGRFFYILVGFSLPRPYPWTEGLVVRFSASKFIQRPECITGHWRDSLSSEISLSAMGSAIGIREATASI